MDEKTYSNIKQAEINMRILWIFFVVILEVTSFIIFKKWKFNVNPDYGTAITSIGKLPSGLTTANLDINLTKPLNGKVLSTTRIEYLRGKKKLPAIRVPTFNYCDMMRGQFMPMQMLQTIIDQVTKFGRLLVPCPVQPGRYYLKDVHIDETLMPMYRLIKENFVIILEAVISQEKAGKMVPVYDLEVHFTCNTSNWP